MAMFGTDEYSILKTFQTLERIPSRIRSLRLNYKSFKDCRNYKIIVSYNHKLTFIDREGYESISLIKKSMKIGKRVIFLFRDFCLVYQLEKYRLRFK